MATLPINQPKSKTEVGNYFISNYPPYSFWKPEHTDQAEAALKRSPDPTTPLGLYMHIPFCRKRCKFCYFRVYTDKNASDVEVYLDALAREIAIYSELPVMRERPFRFAYFGGGTPSFISDKQLRSLIDRLRKYISWDDAEEVTFECEPGTLSRRKVEAIREIGVTRAGPEIVEGRHPGARALDGLDEPRVRIEAVEHHEFAGQPGKPFAPSG